MKLFSQNLDRQHMELYISLVHSHKKKYFVTMVSMTRFYICNVLSSLPSYYVQLLSYKNQSINLQSKSIDWFLHEGNTGI